MKTINKVNQRYQPYHYNNYNGSILLNAEILNNINELHKNAKNDQKSNILSVVAYDYMKPILKKLGFKFSNNQFKNAKNKRINENINLNKYKRHIPESKKKLSEDDIKNIIDYLNKYSQQSSGNKDEIRYLEYTKKYIYNQYIKDNDNRKITYNTFLKYIPKNYKIGKRKTDMCGICVLGKRLNNVNVNRLSEEGKIQLKRNKEIYEDHLNIVENQKNMFNRIKNNLKEYDCILILGFKENFRLNYEKKKLDLIISIKDKFHV